MILELKAKRPEEMFVALGDLSVDGPFVVIDTRRSPEHFIVEVYVKSISETSRIILCEELMEEKND